MDGPRVNFQAIGIGRFARSLRVQLNVAAAIFLALPVALYSLFNAADREKQELVLNAIRDNGLLIAQALQPVLTALTPGDFSRLPAELARFGSDQSSIKLLFKPAGSSGQAGFFYVAAFPTIAADALGAERRSLVDLGVLDRLAESCTGNLPLSRHVTLKDGQGEILTSVSPVQTLAGCWAVVVAVDQRAAFGVIDERAYWARPQSRIALVIYASIAALAVAIFFSLRAGLAKLVGTAQSVEQGAGFEHAVAIPELRPMAREFDRMVARLNSAAAFLRQSAEDNAHAFKAPIAAIRQSLEPLKSALVDDRRSTKALDAISVSLDRLDGLVRSARRLDTATAELLESDRRPIDLTALVQGFAAEYRLMLGQRAVMLRVDAEAGLKTNGNEELLETILENLVDNAVSFSPPGGSVFVLLRRDGAMASLSVLDDGPGVLPDRLDKIFERYYSERGEQTNVQPHYGIGLSLVRQNAEAMGGSVTALNRPEGGLAVTVRLPLAVEV
jgi:two-component system sensor histidine kinase ChvG